MTKRSYHSAVKQRSVLEQIRGAPTGLVGSRGSPPLKYTERQALRSDVGYVLLKSDHPDELFERLVTAAYNLREWKKLQGEATVVGRRDDVERAFEAIRKGRPPRLTTQHLMELDRLRRKFPDCSEAQLLYRLKEGLPKPGRGRRPEYARLAMGIEVAEACRAFLPNPPSSDKLGDYVTLLQAVACASAGVPFKALHSSAERCLKIEVKEIAPGLVEFSLVE